MNPFGNSKNALYVVQTGLLKYFMVGLFLLRNYKMHWILEKLFWGVVVFQATIPNGNVRIVASRYL